MSLKTRILCLIGLLPVFLFSGEWTTYTAADGLADNRVNAVVIDPSGSKWFGTENGLTRFDGVKWTTYRRDTGVVQTLAHDCIYDMAYETARGPELWIGTEGGVTVMGIEVDAVSFATPYTQADRPLVSDRVRAVMVDSLHIKWFGTDKGVSLFNGSVWDTVGYPLDLSSPDILGFGYDKNTDTTYVGTRGGGVSRVSVREWDAVASASPYSYDWSNLPTDTVHSVFVEENGWQWFGTEAGLGFHRGTEAKKDWTYFYEDSGLADVFVESIVRDKNGTLWIGTHAGASTYDGSRWRNYSAPDGPAGVVVDIAVDLDGSLWFATDNGVSHFTGNVQAVESPGAIRPGPNRFVLSNNYPNPFNPLTRIPFLLRGSASVTAEVFDCAGRRIRTISGGRFESGAGVLEWTGTDDSGRGAPAGVYVVSVRARAANWTETQSIKIVIVR
jgi:ligand-binding sensor domain-containing protein